MKSIKYKFVDGTIKTIAVEDKFYEEYQKLETETKSLERKETRRHISMNVFEEKGIEFKDFTSLPSCVEKESDYIIKLTIHEGKFHQVKRMLLAVGNEVVELHRESIGGLVLDPILQEGDYRLLSEEEIQMLIEGE